MTRSEFLSLMLGLPSSGPAKDPSLSSVVLIGYPAIRSQNVIGQNTTTALDGKTADEYLCMVTKKAGRYFWASRENKEMVKNAAGGFITYAAKDGTGYVKVINKAAVPEDVKELPLNYMEHLHIKLFTLTYWGKTSVMKE